MVFTRPLDYDNAEVIPEQGGFKKLPKGGYVCKILGVEENESKAGNPYLLFNLDICEGEYMGFFADDYTSQTGERKWHFQHRLMVPTNKTKPYTLQLFKTFNTYLEDSNPNWKFDFSKDEKQYKGLLIGVLVNEEEYEDRNGKIRRKTNIAKVVKANTIRSGAYTVPDDVLLKRTSNTDTYTAVPDDIDDDDLPFA